MPGTDEDAYRDRPDADRDRSLTPDLEQRVADIRARGDNGVLDLGEMKDKVREELSAAAGGDTECMPVDLPEDDVDGELVPPTITEMPAGVERAIALAVWRKEGQPLRPSQPERWADREYLHREVSAGTGEIDAAIAYLVNHALLFVYRVPLPAGVDDHGQTERFTTGLVGTLGGNARLREAYEAAQARRDAENSEVEQLRARVAQLTAERDGEEALTRIIDSRAAVHASRSSAALAHNRAIEALAEYLRDGSVSNVSRTIARPWLLGERGAVAVPHPTDDPEHDRAEPGMDPERLHALAFAVAAAGEAVSETRTMIGFRLERRVYALQLRGELDDIETGLRRLGDRDHQAPAYIAEHIRRSREILDELERYDAPIRDRGINEAQLAGRRGATS